MGLEDEFNALGAQSLKCKVCDWYQQQDDEVQSLFDRRVASNVAKMHRFCKDRFGLEAEVTSVRRHVRENHNVA